MQKKKYNKENPKNCVKVNSSENHLLTSLFFLFIPTHSQGLILRDEDSPTEAINCFQLAIIANKKSSENYKELAKTL